MKISLQIKALLVLLDVTAERIGCQIVIKLLGPYWFGTAGAMFLSLPLAKCASAPFSTLAGALALPFARSIWSPGNPHGRRKGRASLLSLTAIIDRPPPPPPRARSGPLHERLFLRCIWRAATDVFPILSLGNILETFRERILAEFQGRGALHLRLRSRRRPPRAPSPSPARPRPFVIPLVRSAH